MAWSAVFHASSFSTTSNGYTSGAVNSTGADLIVVAVAEGGASGTLTDSKSNTWTKITPSTTNSHTLTLWYAWNATVGAGHTFSISGTSNFPAMAIGGFASGAQGSDPKDQSNANSAIFQATIAPGSITPTSGNELVVTGVCRDQQSNVPTLPGGWTVYDNVTDAGFGHELAAIGYQIQTTATAANPLWTTTGNSSISASIASFTVSSGGGGATPSGFNYDVSGAPPMRSFARPSEIAVPVVVPAAITPTWGYDARPADRPRNLQRSESFAATPPTLQFAATPVVLQQLAEAPRPPRFAPRMDEVLPVGPPSQVVPLGTGWQPELPDVQPRPLAIDRSQSATPPTQPAIALPVQPQPALQDLLRRAARPSSFDLVTPPTPIAAPLVVVPQLDVVPPARLARAKSDVAQAPTQTPALPSLPVPVVRDAGPPAPRARAEAAHSPFQPPPPPTFFSAAIGLPLKIFRVFYDVIIRPIINFGPPPTPLAKGKLLLGRADVPTLSGRADVPTLSGRADVPTLTGQSED